MKLILIIILICVVMLIANAVSEQIKDKYDFYNNLKLFLNQFKINVSFKKDKILNFLNSVKCKKQFNYFIEEYKSYLSTNNIDLNKITILDEEERKELSEIILNLGRYNTENEINQLNNYLETVNLKLNSALEDKKKFCPMIIKLSLLFSIGLAIILI